MKVLFYMSMMKQCPICKRKVPINKKCECQLDQKKQNKNKHNKKYYEENKEYIGMIKNAKWLRLRKLIIERDGGYCQRCYVKHKTFKVDDLQVHHIKPRIDFPGLVYDDKNLITICRQCNIELGTSHELDFDIEIKDIDYKI